jgi:hypothetical protein
MGAVLEVASGSTCRQLATQRTSTSCRPPPARSVDPKELRSIAPLFCRHFCRVNPGPVDLELVRVLPGIGDRTEFGGLLIWMIMFYSAGFI